MLAFDEVPISYVCPNDEEEAKEGDSTVAMQPIAFNSENLPTFIGVVKCAVEAGQNHNVNNVLGFADDADMDGEESLNDLDVSLDSQNDDIDERKYLIAYWRADEG